MAVEVSNNILSKVLSKVPLLLFILFFGLYSVHFYFYKWC